MAQPPSSRPPVNRPKPVAPPTQTPRTTTPTQLQSMKFLVDLVNTEVPKLPEHLFITHILPILTNTSGSVDLTNWLDVAGTLNRPIDVVDGIGNVLFRVPPLQRTVRTISARDERPNYGNIVTHAELMRRNSPKAADTYLTNALNQQLPPSNIDLEPIRQLNEIFKRYNQPLLPVDSDQNETGGLKEINGTTLYPSADLFTDDLDDF